MSWYALLSKAKFCNSQRFKEWEEKRNKANAINALLDEEERNKQKRLRI